MIIKTLKLKFPAVLGDKIVAIKAVRMLTGMGLKEAKDIADQGGRVAIRTAVTEGTVAWGDGSVVSAEARFDAAVRDLKSTGVEVHEEGREVLKDVRRLAADAVVAGDDDVAMALLEVLRKFR